jgi:hypothetical protein
MLISRGGTRQASDEQSAGYFRPTYYLFFQVDRKEERDGMTNPSSQMRTTAQLIGKFAIHGKSWPQASKPTTPSAYSIKLSMTAGAAAQLPTPIRKSRVSMASGAYEEKYPYARHTVIGRPEEPRSLLG